MLGRDYSGQNCSIARSLEIVGERWTLLILRDAFLGVTRFERFQERLKLAPNILTKRLRALTDAGVLERRPYQERPERYEYVLTERGKGLLPVILGLMEWGDGNLAPNGPPALVVHAGCGGRVEVGAVCGECGERVGADDVDWYFGPGSGRTGVRRPQPV